MKKVLSTLAIVFLASLIMLGFSSKLPFSDDLSEIALTVQQIRFANLLNKVKFDNDQLLEIFSLVDSTRNEIKVNVDKAREILETSLEFAINGQPEESKKLLIKALELKAEISKIIDSYVYSFKNIITLSQAENLAELLKTKALLNDQILTLSQKFKEIPFLKFRENFSQEGSLVPFKEYFPANKSLKKRINNVEPEKKTEILENIKKRIPLIKQKISKENLFSRISLMFLKEENIEVLRKMIAVE
ncbi:MAG: hypothetical protein R6U52_06515 [Kosmotogaceae bacterium]